MALSIPTSRQSLLRVVNLVARSTAIQHNVAARRFLATSPALRSNISQPQQLQQQQQQQQQVLLRRSGPFSYLADASRGSWTSSQQRRCFSAGGRKEDDSDDDFKPQRKPVSDNPDEISDLIKKQVESKAVMLYMKGTPAEPRCGFSAQVVRILHTQGVSFSSVNVLDYPPIREGIKTFSEWPTIPQVFVKGEFVGGCDIVSQMHESGELETLFKEAELRE